MQQFENTTDIQKSSVCSPIHLDKKPCTSSHLCVRWTVLCFRLLLSPSFFPQRPSVAFHVITPRSVNSCNRHCSLHVGWIPAEALAPTSHRSLVPNTVTARRVPLFQGHGEDSAERRIYDHHFPDSRQKWVKRGEQINKRREEKVRKENALQTCNQKGKNTTGEAQK